MMNELSKRRSKILSLIFTLKSYYYYLLWFSELNGDTNLFEVEVVPVSLNCQSVLIVTLEVVCKADSFLFELGTRNGRNNYVARVGFRYATNEFHGKGPTCWDWYPGLSRENNFIWGLFNSYYFCDGTFTLLPVICKAVESNDISAYFVRLCSGLKWIQLKTYDSGTNVLTLVFSVCIIFRWRFLLHSLYSSVVSKYVWYFSLFLSGKGWRRREHSSGAIKKMFFPNRSWNHESLKERNKTLDDLYVCPLSKRLCLWTLTKFNVK